MLQEPDFTKNQSLEKQFQTALIIEIDRILKDRLSNDFLIDFFIIENFGVDIAVFLNFKDFNYIRFFELKAYKGARPDGVGFGNQRGQGVQVDLLQLDFPQLNFADTFVKWILINATKPKGSDRFVVFSNTEAAAAAMGQIKRNKQNNFKVSQLMKNSICWDNLLEEIEHFLFKGKT